MKTFLFWAFCLAAFSSVSADTITLECDTLFTNDGKVYFVKYFGTSKNKVEYALCDDISGQRYTLPVEKVNRIGENKNTQKYVEERKRDDLERLERNAYIYSLVGLVMMGLVGVLGLIFMIIGAVKGEKALRRLKKVGAHPERGTIRRQARTAVIIAVASCIGMISLYLLVLLLI